MPGLMFVQVNIKKSLCDRWPRILNESNPNLVSSDAWYLNIVLVEDLLVHGAYSIKVHIMLKKGHKLPNFGIEMKLYNYD